MKFVQIEADATFLRAFDTAIETVYRQLASAGLGEDAIWDALRRATTEIARCSNEVDREKSPSPGRRPVSHVMRRREQIRATK
jgi:hypothetical protein